MGHCSEGGGWAGGEGEGWGGRWHQLVKNCPEKLHSEDKDTRAAQEAQWTQAGTRVESQVDVIYLVRSTGAIMHVSIPHLHSAKSYPGDWMHSVMILNIATSLAEKIF